MRYIESYITEEKGKGVKRIHIVPDKVPRIYLLGKALCA